MAKVIIHTTMTLDGFIARLNDELDWAFKYAPDEMIEEIMAEIGAVVMGNGGEISEDALPYGGQVKVPQFVVTHKPRDPLTIGGLTFNFIDSIEGASAQAKAAAGEKSVTLLGASIDQQALNAGLVDEIVIHVAPVLIGKRIRLFDNLKAGDIELERSELVATGGLTSLRFRVLLGASQRVRSGGSLRSRRGRPPFCSLRRFAFRFSPTGAAAYSSAAVGSMML